MNTEIKELKEKVQDLKVLYVEDEEDMRVGTELFLNKFFSYVKVAIDGQDGLEKFRDDKFDIVFTDILMPRLNGLEMIENMKKISDKFFIVALTASDVRKEDIEKSANLYFRKPITYENMFIIIRQIVKEFDLK